MGNQNNLTPFQPRRTHICKSCWNHGHAIVFGKQKCKFCGGVNKIEVADMKGEEKKRLKRIVRDSR